MSSVDGISGNRKRSRDAIRVAERRCEELLTQRLAENPSINSQQEAGITAITETMSVSLKAPGPAALHHTWARDADRQTGINTYGIFKMNE